MSTDDSSLSGSYVVARRLMAEAMELEPDEIGEHAAIGELEAWDSLAHMRLILIIEEHLGKPLPPETVVEIGSLDDVVVALAAC